mmetsp:Transcript_36068/g.102688  ORF Transcript_36068/g.102688 Transcript_36068/m.102688 type:complete len:304 (+) Transcript_36068:73-984(+)
MADLQSLVDQLAACDEEGIVTVITSVMQARPETAPAIVQFAVPDLTYPPHRALSERRSAGTIKSYNESKGFGFVACEELSSIFGNDVFLHASQVPQGGVTSGAHVNFAVCLNKDNKPMAYDLQLGGKGGKGGKGQGKPETQWTPTGTSASWATGGKDSGKGWHAMMEAAWNMMTGKGLSKGVSKGAPKGMSKGASKTPSKAAAATLAEDGESIGEFIGTIKSFNPSSGYGFIDCPDVKAQYGNDVFLNSAQIGEHAVGEEVGFEVFENSLGKPQAKNLKRHADGEIWGSAKRQKAGADWGDFA